MKSFSSIVTVSNFKTAARRTFAFATGFVTAAIAAIFAFGLLALSSVEATAASGTPGAGTATMPFSFGSFDPSRPTYDQSVKDATAAKDAACAGGADTPACRKASQRLEDVKDPRGAERRDRECSSLESRLTDAVGKVTEACSKIGSGDIEQCYKKIGHCSAKDADLAAEDFEDEDAPDDDSDRCERLLANQCSHLERFMDGRDYRQEEKDAERDRKDAKKDYDDLFEEQQTLKSDLAKGKADIAEEIANAGIKRGRRAQEILDNADKDRENLSESMKKGLEEARSVYNQMDAKYIELRDKARRSASNVRRALDAQTNTCKQSATAKYMKAETDRLLAQKKGRRNTGTATNLAGGAKRSATKDAKTRNADYAAFINECMARVTPEGQAAFNQVKAAEDSLKDDEQLITDQAALIEKQRIDLINKMKDLESSVPEKEKKIVENLNKELKNLDEDYQSVLRQANQKMTTLVEENYRKDLSVQSKLQSAQQEMQKSMQESLLSKRRYQCQGRAGRGSDSQKDRRLEGGASVSALGNALDNLCTQAKNSQCDQSSTIPGICNTPYAGTANEGAAGGLRRNKKKK